MKKVSIIIPVYNRENDITLCYQSLCKQTYSNIEMIFVNDGSTDNTLNILNTFDKAKVITIKNRGPAEARRVGLNSSSGEYISFVDSDDYLDKNFILNLVNTLEETNTNICLGRFKVEILRHVAKNIGVKARKLPTKIDILYQKEYLSSLNPCLIAKLFKREYVNLQDVNFLANEDIAIIYSMYAKARYISYSKDAIYHYQLSEDSQVKKYLNGYSYSNIKNTLLPLKTILNNFKNDNMLEMYYESIEMIFIKNIFQRIYNITISIKNSKYRSKFISLLLSYLEYYFPLWKDNIYYKHNFPLGEVTDKFNIIEGKVMIKNIETEKMTPRKIEEEYMELEKEYEKKYRK